VGCAGPPVCLPRGQNLCTCAPSVRTVQYRQGVTFQHIPLRDDSTELTATGRDGGARGQHIRTPSHSALPQSSQQGSNRVGRLPLQPRAGGGMATVLALQSCRAAPAGGSCDGGAGAPQALNTAASRAQWRLPNRRQATSANSSAAPEAPSSVLETGAACPPPPPASSNWPTRRVGGAAPSLPLDRGEDIGVQAPRKLNDPDRASTHLRVLGVPSWRAGWQQQGGVNA
jgi:hypothetical protein